MHVETTVQYMSPTVKRHLRVAGIAESDYRNAQATFDLLGWSLDYISGNGFRLFTQKRGWIHNGAAYLICWMGEAAMQQATDHPALFLVDSVPIDIPRVNANNF